MKKDIFLQRRIYDYFLDWEKRKNNKPLIVMGARQVGKTYIIRKFGMSQYDNFIEINLFQRKDIVKLYKSIDSSDNKFKALSLLLNADFEDSNTLLFIDEIQESEELISELKYFNEVHPKMNIICAGSLLGVKIRRSHFSFPVGQVEMINMYPLDFEEFLFAAGEESLALEIKKSFDLNKELNIALHTKALNYYRYYLCVGGMPESVENLLQNDMDITKYNRDILQIIIDAYIADMSKYVSNKSESIKIERVFKSIPAQLSGTGARFKYSRIAKGSRKRDYVLPVDWLLASKLLFESIAVSTPEIPLKGYEILDNFKLFLSDIGIFVNMLNINYGDILIDNIGSYKGIITENYVAVNLLAYEINLNYYKDNKEEHEVDFLLYTKKDGIIPIEVKASSHTKSKSLNSYIMKHKPLYSIKLSTKNFGFTNNIKSVPLYAIFCLKDL